VVEKRVMSGLMVEGKWRSGGVEEWRSGGCVMLLDYFPLKVAGNPTILVFRLPEKWGY